MSHTLKYTLVSKLQTVNLKDISIQSKTHPGMIGVVLHKLVLGSSIKQGFRKAQKLTQCRLKGKNMSSPEGLEGSERKGNKF